MTTTLTDVLRSLGRADALDLRARAEGMDGTHIIREETKIPVFDHEKDYTDWPVGSPVTHEEQVYKLLQPHNAANYKGNPSTLKSLWSICHTKDPDKAKPWQSPNGTSGMYMKDECYKKTDGKVMQSLEDNVVHDADAAPQFWKEVIL